ncbi:uncharacterized protein EV420DRAFT_1487427 [Desarmillaria tabescens]|uniref:Uncharacterized protein n=1 Tax=Armillaria tabescens TaxID=1929756 RepID=A0AA39J7U4_ARMTA|nr:uncharacterized protein EV420DRAFT_1487427 [Desarmillaria tabescens]KAK0436811.1 hypothetical protein EV420DRAFT_1487427 [Desarmillaria tabescens]
MAPHKNYHSPEDKRQAICDKSKRYYAKHKPEISLRRKAVYQAQAQAQASTVNQSTARTVVASTHRTPSTSTLGHKPAASVVKMIAQRKRIANSNHYEIVSVPVAVPQPALCPDPFLKIRADATSLVQEFEDFLRGKDPHEYVEVLLRLYFKNNSRRQGQLSLFVDPLDALYRMQKAYTDITDKALQAIGPCERLEQLIQTGKLIGRLVMWLEDI